MTGRAASNTNPRRGWRRVAYNWDLVPLALWLVIGFWPAGHSKTGKPVQPNATGLIVYFSVLLVLIAVIVVHRVLPARRARRAHLALLRKDPQSVVRNMCWMAGNGVYLGVTQQDHVRYARPQRATLVFGPPRGGKSSAVIIPSVIAHVGPVVSTSTKADVVDATCGARRRAGRCWEFNLDDTGAVRDGCVRLRWSPITSALSWDGALLMARAMSVNVGLGTTDSSHWANRAQALLAPLLHVAAVHGRGMDAVVGWVAGHDVDEPGVLLEDGRCSQLAFASLLGVFNTEARERSSIFSATADALQAYNSETALASAADTNFDADAFVRSQDAVYIHASADRQAAAAPLICGLLTEIRRATYRAHAAGVLECDVLFALDEVANIAPLPELPQIASEGGSQGITLLAALQDLSQARVRWGAAADGFLTLFGEKLLLGGIADQRTLETVSALLGEYDRQVVSHTKPESSFFGGLLGAPNSAPPNSTTYSTQRTRRYTPGQVASIPAGKAMHLDGVRGEILTLTPAYRTEPWRTIINLGQ